MSPPSGLVSWWPGDGNARDLIGANHGRLTGGLGFAPGLVGQAFNCDGTNAFVEVAANASLNLPEFTVETWAFLDPAVLTNRHGILMGKGSLWSCENGFSLGSADLHPSGYTNSMVFQVINTCNLYSHVELPNLQPRSLRE